LHHDQVYLRIGNTKRVTAGPRDTKATRVFCFGRQTIRSDYEEHISIAVRKENARFESKRVRSQGDLDLDFVGAARTDRW
jgi:hypothetical protein